jgi:two-component system sensor histidine kinase/response regulator
MNGYRVLIVEDDAATRDTLHCLLRHRGMLVSLAKSVTEGLAALEQRPHCIILDLTLPDGDGEDILRRVRDDELPCKVAVCTGADDPMRMALVKGMDPSAMFRKPINFDALLEAVGDDTIVGPSGSP